MKLSKITIEKLLALPTSKKFNILLGGVTDKKTTTEYAILLGTSPANAIERSLGAAKLYNKGRIKYIVASGGVKWEHNGKEQTEAEIMAQILKENGVPSDAIIIENEATTTRENMIYATLQINRKCKFHTVDEVMVITSLSHMKRSLALAKAFLPRKVTAYGYPVFQEESIGEWLSSNEGLNTVDQELRLLKRLADDRIIDDIKI